MAIGQEITGGSEKSSRLVTDLFDLFPARSNLEAVVGLKSEIESSKKPPMEPRVQKPRLGKLFAVRGMHGAVLAFMRQWRRRGRSRGTDPRSVPNRRSRQRRN